MFDKVPNHTIRPEINSNDFGFFLELIGIRFSLSRKIFLHDSNFWCVQSSTTCNETVHVHVLWPVSTHTITFRMLWCPWRFTMTYIQIFV